MMLTVERQDKDEEACAKENLARQLNKALGDADMWKQKYEIDGVAKAEELEMAKVYVPEIKDITVHRENRSLMKCQIFHVVLFSLKCKQGSVRAWR